MYLVNYEWNYITDPKIKTGTAQILIDNEKLIKEVFERWNSMMPKSWKYEIISKEIVNEKDYFDKVGTFYSLHNYRVAGCN